MKALNRNQPCPCGSGKRYKHCCGVLQSAPETADRRALFAEVMTRALAAQQSRRLQEAEMLYREALRLDGRSFDALHMLGVICLQRGQGDESCRLLMSALPLMTVDYPPFFKNLGLSLVAAAVTQGRWQKATDAERRGDAHRSFFSSETLPPLPVAAPAVSIVAPCYNHERYVVEAIASVGRQTYPNLELVVIDDGSRDGSVNAVRDALAAFPFPHRFLHRENRGAHATLDEAIGLAKGEYIGVLNTDDAYVPARVEFMVRMLHGGGARWGFSNLSYMDESSQALVYGDEPRADMMMRCHDLLYRATSTSEDFMARNLAITTGNLFFEKSFWQEQGGFRELRYNHDWAFCLDAILVAEPAYFDEPLYRYRLHGGNTIREDSDAARREADAMLQDWRRRLDAPATITNRLFAAAIEDRRSADFSTMAIGAGHLIDRSQLVAYAAELGFPVGGA